MIKLNQKEWFDFMSFKKLIEMKDVTKDFDKKDIESNVAMGVLSYLGILFLVPLFTAKDSKYVKFNVNQGIKICIGEVLYAVIFFIVAFIRAILVYSTGSTLLSLITLPIILIINLVGIIFFILAIMGLVNVIQKKAVKLPLISLVKFDFLK